VSEADALDPQGNIPINVAVSERKQRFYGFGATLSNTEGLGLEGYWGHRNLFGNAEKLRIEGAIGQIGDPDGLSKLNYNARIMFEKPGVIGPASKFFTGLETVYEHPDAYDRSAVKGNVGVAYEISKKQSLSAEFVADFSRITDAFVDDRDYLILSTPLQYIFDNRDDRLNATKGFRLLAYAEPAYDALGGTTFVKLKGEASAYQALGESGKIVLAGRAVLGSILGAGVEDIPANSRFYAGGGGSVRGYAYQGIGPKDAEGQPTGGLSLAEVSAELRFAVTETFGIVPFIDAGTVSTQEFPDFSDLQAGAGVGIRYLTPFGPLRVDAAIPLNKEPGDPDFGIYAGVGQAF
jgi:translocation and assembly module TamA